MINKPIAELALEFGFTSTAQSIYGRTNGVLFSLTDNENEHIFVVNLSHVDIDSRKELVRSLKKNLPTGSKRYRFHEPSKSLFISYAISPLWKDERIKATYQSVLDAIGATIPASPKGETELMGITPIFSSQRPKILALETALEKPLWKRAILSLGFGFLVISILDLAGHLFPKLMFLGFTNVVIFALIVFSAMIFFRGMPLKKGAVLPEAIALISVVLIIFSAWIVVMAAANIPDQFKISPELVRVLINDWFSRFGIIVAIQMTFILVLMVRQIIGFKSKKSLVEPLRVTNSLVESLDMKKKSSRKNGILAVAMLLGGILMASGAMYGAPRDEVWGFSWIVFGLASILYIFTTLLLRWISLNDSKIRFVYQDGEKVSQIKVLFMSLFCSATFGLGYYFVSIRLDKIMDHWPAEIKSGVVGRYLDPKVTAAYCYEVLDSNAQKMPILACERDDKFLREGNVIKYKFKHGVFENGFYFDKEFVHSNTWEDLLNQRKTASSIRYSDISYLKTLTTEKLRLEGSLLSDWKSKCEKGDADYCRISSYVISSEKPSDDELSLLSKGCDLGDFMSCYGFILKKKDEKVQRQGRALAMGLCHSKVLEGCQIYISMWSIDKADISRESIREAFENLCNDGDVRSCDQLIWEKNRI